MAAASPLTDSTSPSTGIPLANPPEKKPDAPPPSAGAPDSVVERVRKAVGHQSANPAPPRVDDVPKWPDLRPLPPAPVEQNTTPVEAWGSLAMLAAALGGARSRTHATTALNAASAALQGLHQRDQEKFKNEMERWKIAVDNVNRVQNYEVDTYRSIMDRRAKTFDEWMKLSNQERLNAATEWHANALALQNERLAWQIEHQRWDEVFKEKHDREEVVRKQQAEADRIASTHTMETTWASAKNAGDKLAESDPNAWKWQYFPEAAEKAGIPKPASASPPTPPAQSPAPQAKPASPSVWFYDGYRHEYKGTGDFDDPKNWTVTPEGGMPGGVPPENVAPGPT